MAHTSDGQGYNGLQRAIVAAFDKSLSIQSPVVASHVIRTRRNRPHARPAKIIGALESQFMASVTATGAAVGGAAALPGMGSGVALALSGGDAIGFMEASTLFALAVGHVHGVEVDDIERRRTLVLAVILGNSGSNVVRKAAGKSGGHWGKQLTAQIPIETIRQVNKVLGHNFVTKYGTKQGVIVVGRLAPFGIGAAIGGAGNALMAQTVIRGARAAFGGPPPEFVPTD